VAYRHIPVALAPYRHILVAPAPYTGRHVHVYVRVPCTHRQVPPLCNLLDHFSDIDELLKDKPTNYEAQGLCLAKTLVPREHVLNRDALFDGLATRSLPVHERTRLGGEIPLGEDVVREVRKTLALEVRHVETDALGRGDLVQAVHVFIVHPNGLGDVRYINTIG
jgi:hypothetical protein